MAIACGIPTRENSFGMVSLELSMSCMNDWDIDIVIGASSRCPWTNGFCSFCCLGVGNEETECWDYWGNWFRILGKSAYGN